MCHALRVNDAHLLYMILRNSQIYYLKVRFTSSHLLKYSSQTPCVDQVVLDICQRISKHPGKYSCHHLHKPGASSTDTCLGSWYTPSCSCHWHGQEEDSATMQCSNGNTHQEIQRVPPYQEINQLHTYKEESGHTCKSRIIFSAINMFRLYWNWRYTLVSTLSVHNVTSNSMEGSNIYSKDFI